MFDRWRKPVLCETQIIDQVPFSEVVRVLGDYIECDAQSVKAEREADGTWTVTVTTPRE